MAYTFTTEAERAKIKQLCDLGISVNEIRTLTGRSYDIITRIRDGKYEERKRADAERQRKLYQTKHGAKPVADNEKILDSVIEKLQEQKDAEERKRQETRRRIREEAEKAGAPRFDDEPEQPKVLTASPFSYDTLLRRVADSTDYTNALLNGVLNKLDMLCKALGVGE